MNVHRSMAPSHTESWSHPTERHLPPENCLSVWGISSNGVARASGGGRPAFVTGLNPDYRMAAVTG
jgi:hypothetical protein